MRSILFTKTRKGFTASRSIKIEGHWTKRKIGELEYFPDLNEYRLFCDTSPEEKALIMDAFNQRLKQQSADFPRKAELKEKLGAPVAIKDEEPIPRRAVNMLFITEGATEKNYLQGIVDHFGLSQYVTVRQALDAQPKKVLDEASKERFWLRHEHNKEVDVWAVFDRGVSAEFQKALEQAQRYGVNVCISNPCIEAWFLQHFTDPNAVLKRTKLYRHEPVTETVRIDEFEEEEVIRTRKEKLFDPEECIKAFKSFVPSYDPQDPDIALKLLHRLSSALENAGNADDPRKAGSGFPKLIGRLHQFAEAKGIRTEKEAEKTTVPQDRNSVEPAPGESEIMEKKADGSGQAPMSKPELQKEEISEPKNEAGKKEDEAPSLAPKQKDACGSRPSPKEKPLPKVMSLNSTMVKLAFKLGMISKTKARNAIKKGNLPLSEKQYRELSDALFTSFTKAQATALALRNQLDQIIKKGASGEKGPLLERLSEKYQRAFKLLQDWSEKIERSGQSKMNPPSLQELLAYYQEFKNRYSPFNAQIGALVKTVPEIGAFKDIFLRNNKLKRTMRLN